MTIKKLCKDRHYRRFANLLKGSDYEAYYCVHCNPGLAVKVINIQFGNYKKLKSHTCKARIKELK